MISFNDEIIFGSRQLNKQNSLYHEYKCDCIQSQTFVYINMSTPLTDMHRIYSSDHCILTQTHRKFAFIKRRK